MSSQPTNYTTGRENQKTVWDFDGFINYSISVGRNKEQQGIYRVNIGKINMPDSTQRIDICVYPTPSAVKTEVRTQHENAMLSNRTEMLDMFSSLTNGDKQAKREIVGLIRSNVSEAIVKADTSDARNVVAQIQNQFARM